MSEATTLRKDWTVRALTISYLYPVGEEAGKGEIDMTRLIAPHVVALTLRVVSVFGIALWLSGDICPLADAADTPPNTAGSRISAPLANLAYVPPKTRNPGGRVGAATRGQEDELPTLMALVPETHTGLSTTDQPSLYWFLSKPTSLPIEFVVQVGTEAKPFLETRLKPVGAPGIQEIRLQEYGIRLQPRVVYQWYVQIVPDQQDRTKDAVAGGFLMHAPAPAAVQAGLTQSPKEEAPRILAEAGLWYDALTALAELIAGAPANQLYRQERAAILKQERMPVVAAWDLGQTGKP